MYPPRHYQAPEDPSGPVAGMATINGARGALLAYPNRNCATQPASHDTWHHMAVAPVVGPNGEGLDETALDSAAC